MMILRTPHARECSPWRTLYIEADSPPYAVQHFASAISAADIAGDDRLAPLLHHHNSAKGACLEGQHLYDLVDHNALIRLNMYTNGVSALPRRVWAE